jgi:Carboxypeptidase regulatory-like domain
MRILLTLLVLPVLAQQGVTVRGTVVNSVSQEPLNNAIVTLTLAGGRGGASFVTESRGGGKFTIQGMTRGKYIVMAQREGYMQEVGGAPGAPPPQILLESGKDLNVVVSMQPLCVIAGRVTDADGDPLRGVNVMAMRYGYVAGKRALNSASSVMADDRGDYRLFGLAPGKYYVRAAGAQRGPGGARQAINAATFFPGTAEAAEAAAVNVAAGGEARGIDIALRRETVFKVRGTLPTPVLRTGTQEFFEGGLEPAIRRGAGLQLTSVSPQAVAGGFPMSMSGQDGATHFEFSDVPPGAYVITATRIEEGHSLYARENVQVGGADVDGVNLTFLPALDVTGKVVWDGAPTGKFEGMRVRLGPQAGTRGGAVPLAPLKEDGTFVLHDVPPQVFELMINGPATSYLKSVQVGGKAVEGREVDFTKGANTLTVVLASDFAEVDGMVKDEKGAPALRVRVTAIPVGRNLGRMDDSRFAFTDENGKFQIAKLAPGDYKMFAWDKVVVGAPQDPEFRKPYEKQGLEIRLESNGRKTADLTVIHVAEQ